MSAAVVKGVSEGVRLNEHGQPIGEDVPGWTRRPDVVPLTLTGRTVTLEPLGEQHADDLHDALVGRSDEALWTYLPHGPFADRPAFDAYLRWVLDEPSLHPHAVVVGGRALGHLSLMRVVPEMGSVEVGHVVLGQALQRTTASTEAQHLLMRHVLDDLGYRRYEWKCDALNAPSRRAALRLGFTFEGIFRRNVVYKGRSRDTAWFAITDADWPGVRAAYDAWLDPANLDADGRQRSRLAAGPTS